MKILIDKNAGFCGGVMKTIEKTEELLAKYPDKKIYVLGEIIHNQSEINRLEKIGLHIAEYEDIPRISKEPNSIIIIRAHGEPPETYEILDKNYIVTVDATCPKVMHLQKLVRKHYEEGYEIVIFGKYNHPETIGLRGFCNNDCTVLRKPEDTRGLNFKKDKVFLISQTTMHRPSYIEIRDLIKGKIDKYNQENESDSAIDLKSVDTICRSVSNRESGLIEFAEMCDVILFVSGRNSSNGKYLYRTAKAANPNTYFVEKIEEIDKEIFKGAQTIGISGATSTPGWYMDKLKKAVEEMVGE